MTGAVLWWLLAIAAGLAIAAFGMLTARDDGSFHWPTIPGRRGRFLVGDDEWDDFCRAHGWPGNTNEAQQ